MTNYHRYYLINILVLLALALITPGSASAQNSAVQEKFVSNNDSNVVRFCTKPPPPVYDLQSEGFYTDSAASKPDVGKLKAEINAARPLNDWLDSLEGPTASWVEFRDGASANCALQSIHDWAAKGALLGSFSKQGAFRRRWTLAGVAIAYLALQDSSSLSGEQRRVIDDWIVKVANQVSPTPTPEKFQLSSNNATNHVAWTGLALIASGLSVNDRILMLWGKKHLCAFLSSVTNEGAHALELKRGRLALHYHLFALQAAAAGSRLLKMAGLPLSIADQTRLDRFATFTYSQSLDSHRLRELTGATQERMNLGDTLPWLAEYGSGLEIWDEAHNRLPELVQYRPYRARWLGGNVTALWSNWINQPFRRHDKH